MGFLKRGGEFHKFGGALHLVRIDQRPDLGTEQQCERSAVGGRNGLVQGGHGLLRRGKDFRRHVGAPGNAADREEQGTGKQRTQKRGKWFCVHEKRQLRFNADRHRDHRRPGCVSRDCWRAGRWNDCSLRQMRTMRPDWATG